MLSSSEKYVTEGAYFFTVVQLQACSMGLSLSLSLQLAPSSNWNHLFLRFLGLLAHSRVWLFCCTTSCIECPLWLYALIFWLPLLIVDFSLIIQSFCTCDVSTTENNFGFMFMRISNLISISLIIGASWLKLEEVHTQFITWWVKQEHHSENAHVWLSYFSSPLYNVNIYLSNVGHQTALHQV